MNQITPQDGSMMAETNAPTRKWKKRFTCELCKKDFSSEQYLKNHYCPKLDPSTKVKFDPRDN